METKELYESPMKEKNLIKYGDQAHSCICCGKPTKEKLFIHMVTTWEAVPANIDELELEDLGLESQGVFPIGSSCAKKMGKKYIIKE